MGWLITADESKCLAFIPRNGSTAFGRAFLSTFYPDRLARLTQCKMPPGRTEAPPQLICPTVIRPPAGCQAFALIRDPVERFLSGVHRVRRLNPISVDDALAMLEADPRRADLHIRPQSLFVAGVAGVALYRFPDGAAACAARLGFDAPRKENESQPGAKPTISDSQRARLQAIYADDAALFAEAAAN